TIATIQLPAFPQKPLLRPATWNTIISLRRVIEDVRVVERSVSNTARSFALNRALGELKDILNNQDTLPQAEKDLIIDIAETWQEALLQIAGEVGEIAITEPIRNPYIIGDPVEGNLFVGREDIIRQLEELWLTNHQVQSVVIYGHRRMGKTSILRNVANRLGAEIKLAQEGRRHNPPLTPPRRGTGGRREESLYSQYSNFPSPMGYFRRTALAYINLLDVGDASQGVGEVLMAICDGIAEAVNLPPPADEDLLHLPYPTFRRYLKEVEAQLDHQSLIIALDEFEQIEELINRGKIAPDLIKVLRSSVQKSQHIGFAFAGLHTLEEMTEDYFQPFFASVIPIHVSFLAPAATHQILANPAIEDFPLDYTPETLDQIYSLTAGQPYLVQLVGFQLVHRYNNQVFEQKRDREPVFTPNDLEAVINNPDFLNKGRYYFTGVWGQATEGAPGQQEILRILAPHPSGLSQSALAAATNLDEATLLAALQTLNRHDVIHNTQETWQISVELFRRWVFVRC
ncbi:MAG: AAA family ATPase, partial [Symploca sp. SIO3E6]|nr:AAA family ATPase [Caldora sp. SIO3E6]